ncbi:hypothetical protein EDF56_102397 [Novosphingobium sp. PhB165]|nr:hypothetical protein EDF56_102397 [Novosphingobium sp. PhB165]
MVDVIERDITEFGPKDGVKPANPRLLAELFLGMIGAVHTHLGESGGLSASVVDQHLDHAVDIILNGKVAW